MNCKPGDLAVIVSVEDKAMSSSIGKLVTVIRAYDGVASRDNLPGWWVDYKGREYHANDRNLRPIRPGSEDETTEREVAHAA